MTEVCNECGNEKKSYYCTYCSRYHNRVGSDIWKRHKEFERKVPSLSVAEIFGIFFIVLIIEFLLKMVPGTGFWDFVIIVFMSGSLSAGLWIGIVLLLRKCPSLQDTLVNVHKPNKFGLFLYGCVVISIVLLTSFFIFGDVLGLVKKIGLFIFFEFDLSRYFS